jgi:hypothetical protein
VVELPAGLGAWLPGLLLGLARAVAVAAVTWWWAFHCTRDLDTVGNRTLYRLGLWMFWLQAVMWWLQRFGVIDGG